VLLAEAPSPEAASAGRRAGRAEARAHLLQDRLHLDRRELDVGVGAVDVAAQLLLRSTRMSLARRTARARFALRRALPAWQAADGMLEEGTGAAQTGPAGRSGCKPHS
jgi:hypothetical protein